MHRSRHESTDPEVTSAWTSTEGSAATSSATALPADAPKRTRNPVLGVSLRTPSLKAIGRTMKLLKKNEKKSSSNHDLEAVLEKLAAPPAALFAAAPPASNPAVARLRPAACLMCGKELAVEGRCRTLICGHGFHHACASELVDTFGLPHPCPYDECRPAAGDVLIEAKPSDAASDASPASPPEGPGLDDGDEVAAAAAATQADDDDDDDGDNTSARRDDDGGLAVGTEPPGSSAYGEAVRRLFRPSRLVSRAPVGDWSYAGPSTPESMHEAAARR